MRDIHTHTRTRTGPDDAMLLCSRSIGDRNFKLTTPPFVTSEPDTLTREIAPDDDLLVIASDGVWDEIGNKRACDIVAGALTKGGSLEAACKALCEAAHAAGSRDNISAVVLRVRK